MHQFLDSSKFNQEEISNLNQPMTNKETETVTESLWGQACVRSIPAWRSREVILLNFKLWRWSFDSLLRNLKILGFRSHKKPVKKTCPPGVETVQDREVCCTQQNWKEIEFGSGLVIKHVVADFGVCPAFF